MSIPGELHERGPNKNNSRFFGCSVFVSSVIETLFLMEFSQPVSLLRGSSPPLPGSGDNVSSGNHCHLPEADD